MIDIPKILLVEDNHMNSRLTEFVLEREGFQVDTVTTGEEAVVAVRNDKPDLILMDIQLPGMDGLEATRIIKDNPATADIPIVAVTAHAMRGDEERIIQAGCEAYIAKPINTWKLGDTLSAYLKN